MQDGSGTTRGVAWIALLLLVGGFFLPLAIFVVLITFAEVPRTSAGTISLAMGVGFAWLLALVLGVASWRHFPGKVTAIGAVIVAGLATFVVWQQFTHPTAELDGTWQTVRMEYEDGSTRNDRASVTRLTIVGEKLTCSFTHPIPPGDIDGFITIDATQSPKTFEARGIRGAVSFDWLGIYEIEGDTLKLCFATDGKGARPKEFKSNPAGMTMLLVLKRVK